MKVDEKKDSSDLAKEDGETKQEEEEEDEKTPVKKRGGKRGGAKTQKQAKEEEKKVEEDSAEEIEDSAKPEPEPQQVAEEGETAPIKPDESEVGEIRIELNIEDDCVVSMEPEPERESKSTGKGKRGGFRGKKSPSVTASNNNNNSNSNNNNSNNSNNNSNSVPPKKKGIFKQSTELTEANEMDVEGTMVLDKIDLEAEGEAKTEDEQAIRQKILDDDFAAYEAELERRRLVYCLADY